LVDEVTDVVYAMLILDLQIERERAPYRERGGR
jgi:hypothetical protein